MSLSASPVFRQGNLVIYKNSPAVVVSSGAKIEIELPGGTRVSVRPKDIEFLHPGPAVSLRLPDEPPEDLESAWEIFQGQTTTVQAFAEVLYTNFTPVSALAVWRLVQDGLYMRGSPGGLYVFSKEEYEKEAAARKAKEDNARDRADLLERIRQGKLEEGDKKHVREIEDFALGRSVRTSRMMKDLGIPETPEAAHALLLKLGVWDFRTNPHVSRFGLPEKLQYPPLPVSVPEEERLDLTHLAAIAIDDEGSEDPDDAVSFDGGRLIVHVADPASIITPDSPADLAARDSGATLYLPDRKITMLPPEAVCLFGLGIQEISPALSFFIAPQEDGSPGEVEIKLTKIRVTRMTYTKANEALDTSPLKEIFSLTSRYHAYRMKNGALDIDLPEVKIRAGTDGNVSIHPLPKTDAGTMVQDAMLMAGQAAARFAGKYGIPAPYASQRMSDSPPAKPQTLPDMFECRKKLHPSAVSSFPAPHSGTGLDAYCRATSPLRRYLDLVLHQQIRAFLLKRKLLGPEEITARIGAVEVVSGIIQKAERASNLHWTLVYLLQNPGWQGRGIVVEKKGNLCTVILPDIGLEAKANAGRNALPGEEFILRARGIDLARLAVNFEPAPLDRTNPDPPAVE
jgi:exoribonuclease-2